MLDSPRVRQYHRLRKSCGKLEEGSTMAIQTKDIGAIAAKWSSRAQAAGPDYTAGVKGTQKDWAGLTAQAADNFAAGVSQAVADGRFARGVQAAGTDKWRNAAAGKGAQRYPSG